MQHVPSQKKKHADSHDPDDGDDEELEIRSDCLMCDRPSFDMSVAEHYHGCTNAYQHFTFAPCCHSQVTGGQNGSVLSSSEFYRPELDEWQAGS